MARTKRIYILIIKVTKLFSFFSSWCFLKEIENMYSLFLSSYTNTRESLGELEKAVETASVPTAFLVIPNFHSCLYNSIETRVVYHLPKKSGNFRWNVNGRLILSPRTEIFSGKRDFLEGRPKFPNGISEWKSAFHLLLFTSSGPFGLDRL